MLWCLTGQPQRNQKNKKHLWPRAVKFHDNREILSFSRCLPLSDRSRMRPSLFSDHWKIMKFCLNLFSFAHEIYLGIVARNRFLTHRRSLTRESNANFLTKNEPIPSNAIMLDIKKCWFISWEFQNEIIDICCSLIEIKKRIINFSRKKSDLKKDRSKVNAANEGFSLKMTPLRYFWTCVLHIIWSIVRRSRGRR